MVQQISLRSSPVLRTPVSSRPTKTVVRCCRATTTTLSFRQRLGQSAIAISSAVLLAASPAWADQQLIQPVPRLGPSDDSTQRAQMAEIGRSKQDKANYEEDATKGNPNDTARPSGRSQQAQPAVSLSDKQARGQQFKDSLSNTGEINNSPTSQDS